MFCFNLRGIRNNHQRVTFAEDGIRAMFLMFVVRSSRKHFQLPTNYEISRQDVSLVACHTGRKNVLPLLSPTEKERVYFKYCFRNFYLLLHRSVTGFTVVKCIAFLLYIACLKQNYQNLTPARCRDPQSILTCEGPRIYRQVRIW